MGKIICEICGTVYPDTSDSCPICGYSRDHSAFSQGEDLLEDQQPETAQYDHVTAENPEEYEFDDYDLDADKPQEPVYIPQQPKGPQPQQGKKPIFDYDAVNPGQDEKTGDSYEDLGNELTLDDYPEENYDNYDNYDQGERKSHPGLIIFLVLLILALIGASAFLLMKFIMPNLGGTEPVIETTAIAMMTEAPTTAPTTEPTVPCESLALVEGGEVSLSREGQFYLIHAAVTPENTTDSLSYRSEDETIILVDEGGKITAVGEGTTNVVLTCGSQIIKLPVTVAYVEETQPVETAPETEAQAEGEAPAEGETQAGENAETEAPAENNSGLKDVELKLKRTDLSSSIPGVSFTLELDCDLTPEEVQWSTTNSAVALVKNGEVTTVGGGICKIIAKYGDQEVTCLIRCNF